MTVKWLAVLSGLVIGSLTLSACGTATSLPTTTTVPLIVKAANAYFVRYNQWVDASNAAVPKENSSIPATAAAGWNQSVAASRRFDNLLGKIKFPSNLQHYAEAIVSTDGAMEDVEGTLSANTDSVDNYNQVFDTLTPVRAAFMAATKTLCTKLGLKNC